MNKHSQPFNQYRQHGTVYVVMLAVLSIVMTISLSSLISARTELASSSRGSEESTARSIARSALEIAVQRIQSNPSWRQKVSGGILIGNTDLGNGRFRVLVQDPDDGDLLDQYDDPVELLAHAEYGQTVQKISCRLDYAVSHNRSPAPIMSQFPIGYWPLQELDNNDSHDLRGGDSARLRGTIVYEPTDPTGNYRMQSLSTVNGTRYDIPHNDSMELDYGSIALWIQPSSTYATSSLTQVAVSKWKWDDKEAVQMAVLCTNGNVYLVLDYAGNMGYLNLGSITGDQWHHICVTWGEDGWNGYLDGDLTARSNTRLGLGEAWTIKPNMEKWRIGAADDLYRRLGMPSGLSDHFNGKICDFAIYAYELTASQIRTLADFQPEPVPLVLDHESVARVVD